MNEKQNPPAVAPGSALGCPVRQQSCLLDSGDRSPNKGEKNLHVGCMFCTRYIHSNKVIGQ